MAFESIILICPLNMSIIEGVGFSQTLEREALLPGPIERESVFNVTVELTAPLELEEV